MPKGSSRKGIGGWKRGARPGNYTDMQLNIACRISKGFDQEGCSWKKQAAISLHYLPKNSCGTGNRHGGGASPCRGVGANAPVGAYGRAHS
jgi:hypothetical protein